MGRFKFIKGKNFNELPKTSGVYVFYLPAARLPARQGRQVKKTPIYIGKAVNIKNRVKSHFNQPSYRDNFFISKVDKIGYFETNSEIEALILEANLIKKHQPKFNVMWRDDKKYFFVALRFARGKHAGLPYIFITHQKNQQKAEYVGPFVEGTALKKTLRFLRRVFPHYTSPKHPKTKCAYCHLDLCPGPEPDLNLYKKNIKKLILILQGKRSAVLKSLRKEMKKASKNNEFEEAGKIRDRLFALQQIMAHTHVIEQSKKDMVRFLPRGKNLTNAKILAGVLGAKNAVHKIECYDVSNIQGKHATGSMVVFMDGRSNKNQYRKFKIRMEQGPNDIAMLKETLIRRFLHPEWVYPDAILIDGGKAQLNVAITAKNLNLKTRPIKVMSIAKGRQELFIEGRKDPIPLKSLPQEVYNLIKHLDDEAHRFAIKYHKTLRSKNLLQ